MYYTAAFGFDPFAGRHFGALALDQLSPAEIKSVENLVSDKRLITFPLVNQPLNDYDVQLNSNSASELCVHE